MSTTLIDITLRGSVVCLLVLLCERYTRRRLPARWRRMWWWVLVLAWLFPLRIPLHQSVPRLPSVEPSRALAMLDSVHTPSPHTAVSGPPQSTNVGTWLVRIWAMGSIGLLAFVGWQTLRTERRWRHDRLCTDHDLLELLEDCKARAGVRMPIGLVLSDRVSVPSLLGWLRPRILLPSALMDSLPRDQQRAILLHELAHLAARDIPVQWLFTLAQALNWFNPLVHLAAARWGRVRELAADEAALRWMSVDNFNAYGAALVRAVRHEHHLPLPHGALGMGEPYHNLKERIHMIAHPNAHRRSGWLVAAVSLALATFVMLPAATDEDSIEAAKAAAAAAADEWLHTIDQGDYAASHAAAGAAFRSAVTEAQWVSAMHATRLPLGELTSRKLLSQLYQASVPMPGGGKLEGKFVILQYETAFANLASGMETLTFQQENDGTWRSVGYYIRPR